MKKIKLLLFGIVSIFGIGLSLGNDSLTYFSKYTTSNNTNAGEFINLSNGSYNFGDDCVILRDGSTRSIDGENWYAGNGHDLLCGGPVYFSGVSSVKVLVFTGAFSYNSLSVYGSTGDDLTYSAQYEIVPGYSLFPYSSPDSCVSVLRAPYSGIEFYSEPGVKIGDMNNGFGILICGEFYFFNIYGESKYFNDLYLYSGAFHSSSNGGGDSGPSSGHIIVDGGYTTFASLVLETAILCYMSDGDYNYTSYYIEDGGLSCSDLGGSSGYVPFVESLGITNDTGIENKYWSGDYNNSGFPYGKLVFDDAKNVLQYYCSDSRYSYSFCDDLDLFSGSYLFYQFNNGVLEYNIIGENILLSFDTMSGVITDMSCYGVRCSSFPNTGFTQIDVNVFGSGGSIGDLTGELSGYFVHQFQGFTSGSYTPQNFYSDYFKKGYFFRCPYNVKQYITLGSRLDSHLKQYSPAYPINCFISSFEAGRNLLLFKNSSGYYWSGSLINGNSDDYQRLFTFFDIILSFGLIVVLGKLFNILSNSGD